MVFAIDDFLMNGSIDAPCLGRFYNLIVLYLPVCLCVYVFFCNVYNKYNNYICTHTVHNYIQLLFVADGVYVLISHNSKNI